MYPCRVFGKFGTDRLKLPITPFFDSWPVGGTFEIALPTVCVLSFAQVHVERTRIVVGSSEATMFGAVAEFVSTQQGDSAVFMGKARALAIGVARDYEPARLYVIRIDNWFGPKWMHFAGKALGLVGVHPTSPLHLPPFVPHRVVAERVFVGPGYEETVLMPPLHIECPSSRALHRRITDIDKDAAFVWFSGESGAQRRGSVMVSRRVKSAGSQRCCVGVRVARWHILRRAVEL
jgi:hypothetical protein